METICCIETINCIKAFLSIFKDNITLIIAFITVFTGLIQLKANQITGARLKWIDELRSDFSKYIAEIASENYELKLLDDLIEEDKKKAEEEYNKIILKYGKQIEELSAKISLYLNKSEPDHDLLKNLLKDYLEISTGGEKKVQQTKEITELQEKLIEQASLVLYNSWSDAKSYILKELFTCKWNTTGSKTSKK